MQVKKWSVANEGKVRDLGFVSFLNKKWMKLLSVKLNILFPFVFLFQEFEAFQTFVENRLPFDIVIDGLNVSHVRPRKMQCENVSAG